MNADKMREALEACKRVFDVALPKFNWGASSLDAEAIELLNTTPGLVNEALSARGDVESAKQRYERMTNGNIPENDIEALRFFLSLSLNSQDWLDVEPFIDAVTPQPPPVAESPSYFEQLSELMRGLEIPPAAGAMLPGQLYLLGKAIAKAAKGAPVAAVPDERKESRYFDEYERGVIAGWNDCRDAMLAAQEVSK